LAQPADEKPLKDVVKTVSREPAAASPSPRKAMIDSGQPLKTPSVEAQPAAAPAKTAATPAPAPAASAAAAPATETTRSSRRQSSAGYVSPTEVNPFFVTRYGDTQ
jgi:hypothetical protein